MESFCIYRQRRNQLLCTRSYLYHQDSYRLMQPPAEWTLLERCVVWDRGCRLWVGLIHGTSIIVSHINPSSRRIVANSVWHHAVNSPVQSSVYFQLFPLGFTTICIKYDTTFKTWRHHFLRYSMAFSSAGEKNIFHRQVWSAAKQTVTLA